MNNKSAIREVADAVSRVGCVMLPGSLLAVATVWIATSEAPLSPFWGMGLVAVVTFATGEKTIFPLLAMLAIGLIDRGAGDGVGLGAWAFAAPFLVLIVSLALLAVMACLHVIDVDKVIPGGRRDNDAIEFCMARLRAWGVIRIAYVLPTAIAYHVALFVGSDSATVRIATVFVPLSLALGRRAIR